MQFFPIFSFQTNFPSICYFVYPFIRFNFVFKTLAENDNFTVHTSIANCLIDSFYKYQENEDYFRLPITTKDNAALKTLQNSLENLESSQNDCDY